LTIKPFEFDLGELGTVLLFGIELNVIEKYLNQYQDQIDVVVSHLMKKCGMCLLSKKTLSIRMYRKSFYFSTHFTNFPWYSSNSSNFPFWAIFACLLHVTGLCSIIYLFPAFSKIDLIFESSEFAKSL